MISYPNVKLNLGLSVLRKREDGFHELETLFIPYKGMNDVLEITPSDEFSIEIVREGGIDWDPMQDLTAKAYRMLCLDFDLPPVKIHLEKHNPVGAGLGGGSADAAFALKMLNEIGNLHLSERELAAYAARLGSDCSFFIYNRPMIGRGRGELLEPFKLDLSAYKIDVVVPQGIAVSTKEAYAGITPREKMSQEPCPLMDALERPVSEWKDCLFNDFETSVFKAHPELSAIKEDLYRDGAIYASMSGSGSAIFSIKPLSAV